MTYKSHADDPYHPNVKCGAWCDVAIRATPEWIRDHPATAAMTDKNVTPATEAYVTDDGYLSAVPNGPSLCKWSRVPFTECDMTQHDMSHQHEAARASAHQILVALRAARQRIDADATVIEELRRSGPLVWYDDADKVWYAWCDYLADGESEADARERLADGWSKTIALNRERGISPGQMCDARYPDTTATELVELRAVVGPRLECGRYAVEHREIATPSGDEFEGWLACPAAYSHPGSPEYLAWREPKQKGG